MCPRISREFDDFDQIFANGQLQKITDLDAREAVVGETAASWGLRAGEQRRARAPSTA